MVGTAHEFYLVHILFDSNNVPLLTPVSRMDDELMPAENSCVSEVAFE